MNEMKNVMDNYFPNTYHVSDHVSPNTINDNVHMNLIEHYNNFKAKGNLDIESFTTEMNKLLKLAWGEDWGTFTMEFPTGNNPNEIKTPIISFGITNRINSTSFKGVRARIFESFLDPEDTNYTLILSRKWYDCEIEFMFYEKTNKDARKLMSSFEMLFEAYMGYFKELGITNITFQGETDSRLSKGYKQDLPSTRLVYSLLLESIKIERVRTTKHLPTKVSTNKSSSIAE